MPTMVEMIVATMKPFCVMYAWSTFAFIVSSGEVCRAYLEVLLLNHIAVIHVRGWNRLW